jgi:hypothetical protein
MITVWTHGRLEPSLWCHARGSFLPCIACLWQLSISWHDARMRWRRRVLQTVFWALKRSKLAVTARYGCHRFVRVDCHWREGLSSDRRTPPSRELGLREAG